MHDHAAWTFISCEDAQSYGQPTEFHRIRVHVGAKWFESGSCHCEGVQNEFKSKKPDLRHDSAI